MKWLKPAVALVAVVLIGLGVWRALALASDLAEQRAETARLDSLYSSVKADNAALIADTARFRERQDSLAQAADSLSGLADETLRRLQSTADTARLLAEGHGDENLVRMIDSVQVRADRGVAEEREAKLAEAERADRAEARVDSLVRQLILTEVRADSVISSLRAEIDILERPTFRVLGIAFDCRSMAGGAVGIGGAAAGLAFGCGPRF